MAKNVDPKTSAGGRMARRAMLAKVRRMQKAFANGSGPHMALEELAQWLLASQKRYGKRTGGL